MTAFYFAKVYSKTTWKFEMDFWNLKYEGGEIGSPDPKIKELITKDKTFNV